MNKEEREKRVAEIYEANRPKFHDWGTLKQMCIATAIQYADEYASQFSEPEGKEAVEFCKWKELNFEEFDLGVYISFIEPNPEKPRNKYSIEQLFKIWKAEAK